MATAGWIALAITVFGAFCYAAASILQAVAARRSTSTVKTLGHPLYLIGIGCDALAWVGSMIALRELAVYVVESILAGSLAVTVVAARFILKSRLRKRDVAAIAASLAALTVLALSAGPQQQRRGLHRDAAGVLRGRGRRGTDRLGRDQDRLTRPRRGAGRTLPRRCGPDRSRPAGGTDGHRDRAAHRGTAGLRGDRHDDVRPRAADRPGRPGDRGALDRRGDRAVRRRAAAPRRHRPRGMAPAGRGRRADHRRRRPSCWPPRRRPMPPTSRKPPAVPAEPALPADAQPVHHRSAERVIWWGPPPIWIPPGRTDCSLGGTTGTRADLEPAPCAATLDRTAAARRRSRRDPDARSRGAAPADAAAAARMSRRAGARRESRRRCCPGTTCRCHRVGQASRHAARCSYRGLGPRWLRTSSTVSTDHAGPR